MNYSEAIEYLYSKAPFFSRIGKSAYKANLDNTFKLDQYFNRPYSHYKTIHIAGTNGKGSVSHTLAAILQEAGYKTGLYTSPHLKDFRERIKINGIKIPENEVITFVEQYKQLIEKIQPSFFEITSFLAFEYFKKEHVDIAVIETGLGGRLDTTNIITPILSIITNVGWDHADLLGNSIEKIAIEKAGIIKKQVPVIIGEKNSLTDKIFINQAQNNHSDIFFAEDYFSIIKHFITQNNLLQLSIRYKGKDYLPGLKYQLTGVYQLKNIPAILMAIELLKQNNIEIDEHCIYRGFSNVVNLTEFKGRWQILKNKPLTICDIAHNEPALAIVLNQLINLPHKNLYIIFGMVKDKDINRIMPLLPQNAYYFFTQANIPRALPANELFSLAQKYHLIGEIVDNPQNAVQIAYSKATIDDVIFIGGSTFIVAEVL